MLVPPRNCGDAPLASQLRLRLHSALRPATRCTHAPRAAGDRIASPHAYRADRPIKKKPQGRRNPPANEAVTKWLIIETLERATLEEIVQFAFCVCDA